MYSGSKASRIQAGLSHGLILVQSKIDGGSKYTLAKFAKLGRPIGVIHFPSSAEYQSESFGANRLDYRERKGWISTNDRFEKNIIYQYWAAYCSLK